MKVDLNVGFEWPLGEMPAVILPDPFAEIFARMRSDAFARNFRESIEARMTLPPGPELDARLVAIDARCKAVLAAFSPPKTPAQAKASDDSAPPQP